MTRLKILTRYSLTVAIGRPMIARPTITTSSLTRDERGALLSSGPAPSTFSHRYHSVGLSSIITLFWAMAGAAAPLAQKMFELADFRDGTQSARVTPAKLAVRVVSEDKQR